MKPTKPPTKPKVRALWAGNAYPCHVAQSVSPPARMRAHARTRKHQRARTPAHTPQRLDATRPVVTSCRRYDSGRAQVLLSVLKNQTKPKIVSVNLKLEINRATFAAQKSNLTAQLAHVAGVDPSRVEARKLARKPAHTHA